MTDTTGNRLYFDLAKVVEIIEATLKAPDHSSSFADLEDGEKTGPALVWAKDAGTYLMGNALPRPDGSAPLFANAYAPDGLLLDNRREEGVWEEIRGVCESICGGDDFAEYFELNDGLGDGLKEALDAGATHFVIDVGPGILDLMTVGP